MRTSVVIITAGIVVVLGIGVIIGVRALHSHDDRATQASANASGGETSATSATTAPPATSPASRPARPASRPMTEPAMAPVPPIVAADGTIVLPAQGARITGYQLRLEHPALPNLTYWIDPQEYPQWRRWVPKAGKYAVEITYACAPNSGGRYRVFAGATSIVATAEPTGGWDKYRTVTLPDALLVPTDWCTISVKCEGVPNHALMNLQRIRLIRSK